MGGREAAGTLQKMESVGRPRLCLAPDSAGIGSVEMESQRWHCLLMADPNVVRRSANEIRNELAAWMKENTTDDNVRALATALLELAVNQHIGIMGRAKALDLLAGMFARRH